MNYFSRTFTTLAKESSRVRLVRDYEKIMKISKPVQQETSTIKKPDYIKTPKFSKNDHPYLTAGGKHEMDVETIIYNLQNYVDGHYQKWKETKR